MMPTMKPPKWTRAVKKKKPDGIVSSDFATTEPFKPSYEGVIFNLITATCLLTGGHGFFKKEPVSMFKLLAMDYARQWHIEKQEIKEGFIVSNEAAFLQRRYVIRGLLRRMQQANKEEKRFIMKKFMNIPSRYREYEKGGKKVPVEAPKEKGLSKKASKESAKSVETIRKTVPTFKKDVEPCGESSSTVTPCTSQSDLVDVCQRDDLDKRECRLGDKKSDKKEKSEKFGKVTKKPDSAKKKEATPVLATATAATTVLVATAKTQASSAAKVDTEEECVCTCSCPCTAFRNAEDDSRSSLTSSTLPEYKSVSRESVDGQINAPVKCHIHV